MPVQEGDWPADAAFEQTPGDAIDVTPTPDPPAPKAVEESHPDEESGPAAAAPVKFDDAHREDFKGLLYLGRVEDEFEYLGHTFRIRTLTTDKFLEIGLLLKPYRDSLAEARAYAAAIVAACVVSVDGEEMPIPLTREESDVATRFRYVQRSWYPPIIDAIYDRFLMLESRVEKALVALGEASR